MLTGTLLFALPIFCATSVLSVPGAAAADMYYHPSDHPVHALFKRQDGQPETFPEIGSPEWSAGYPAFGDFEGIKSLVPQEWKDVLAAAMSAGKIPDIPMTTIEPNKEPVVPLYPNGIDGASKDICSSTTKACRNEYDIWDAPPGSVGAGFDDGPVPIGHKLYSFLKKENISATHFMIGVTILQNPVMFKEAYEELGNPIAGHSWSHRHHTSLTNEELLGEFGFTLKIIRDSTKGRLAKYWRPPAGDLDNRVEAIAREVFGLTAIHWNHDTDDWGLASGAIKLEGIQERMQQWLSPAAKSGPGPIILHHEHSELAIDAFINGYPVMVANGWKVDAVSSLFGSSYQNAEADSEDSEVKPMAVARLLDGSSSPPTSGPSDDASSSGGASPTTSPTSGSAAPAGTSAGENQSTSAARKSSVTWPLVMLAIGVVCH